MKIVTISGRDFRFVENDIESDHYHLALYYLWPSWIEQVLRWAGESDESYAQRIYSRLHENPNFYTLMGCIILPATLPESEWSPFVAFETARFLREMPGVESKSAFPRQVVDAVINFCMVTPVHLPEATESQRSRS